MRKRNKAEVKADTPVHAKKRFLEVCDAYQAEVRSVMQIPYIFQIGVNDSLSSFRSREKSCSQRLKKAEKAIKVWDGLVHESKDADYIDDSFREALAQQAATNTQIIHEEVLPSIRASVESAQIFVRAYERIACAAGQHVRPSCFVYAMAKFDAFIGDALVHFYSLHPKQMNSEVRRTDQTKRQWKEEKKVSYDEAFEADSLTALVRTIVEREVSAVMRENVGVQLDALKECGAADWSPEDRAELAEISATRNAYVHCAGRINEDYLKKSKDHWERKGDCPYKLGQIRAIDDAYVLRAGEVILQIIEAVRNKVGRARTRSS